MRGWLAVFAVAVATGASPPEATLPLPPIPPPQPPTDQSAPLPDRDARAPALGPLLGGRVTVQDFRIRRFQQGLGYARGSEFESNEDKRPIQTPGVTVRVPLQ